MVQCSHQYERSAPVFGTIHSLGQVSPEIRHTANPLPNMWNAVRLPCAGGAVFLSASVTASGPAMQNPLTGFLFPMGNKRGFSIPHHTAQTPPSGLCRRAGFFLSFFSSSARTANSRPPGYQSPPPAHWRCTATCRTGNRSPDSCCSPPPTGSSPPGGSGHSGNTPAGG